LTLVPACSPRAAGTLDVANAALVDDGPPPGRSSTISTAVLAALDAAGSSKWHQTWNVSHDNVLDPGWLLQTPPKEYWGQSYSALPIPAACTGPDCDPEFQLQRCATQAECTGGGICTEVAATVREPGGTPARLCTGHSDSLYDSFYRVIVAGERFVDVTSLTPPDGRFEPALRNAITYLAHTGRPVTIRLLFGDYPIQDAVNSKKVLRSLVRDVPAGSPLRVFVGNYRSSDAPPSWNHAKTVSADANVAIVGGHNFWTQHYLEVQPVHDLSLQVRGTAAADVHRFANDLWSYTCAHRSPVTYLTWSVWVNSYLQGRVGDDCPEPYVAPNVDGPGKATVIAAGRLGEIDCHGTSNQSDVALHALVGQAQRTIRMSLQDIGPPAVPGLLLPLGQWPEALFARLGDALTRGVDVYIIVSNQGARAGGLPPWDAQYNNGWSVTQVAQKIHDYMIAHPLPNAPTGAALRALLCQRLHVAPLRFSPEGTWAGGVPAANHAKLVLIDDQAFYIGSQNQYIADLTEFGYIVDDARAAGELYRDYWAPAWQYSSVAAVTGGEAASCSL
jgi:phosphatidylserine/phosphatidylglycerophosphate/cardiolipin synthase-like enzyme